MSIKAANTGMVIIGGGVVKHHICNANLMVCMGYLPLENHQAFDISCREMVRTMVCSLTLLPNSMVAMRVPDRMKRFLGEKSRRTQYRLRFMPRQLLCFLYWSGKRLQGTTLINIVTKHVSLSHPFEYHTFCMFIWHDHNIYWWWSWYAILLIVVVGSVEVFIQATVTSMVCLRFVILNNVDYSVHGTIENSELLNTFLKILASQMFVFEKHSN